jgi:excisionase family DNA binding protein
MMKSQTGSEGNFKRFVTTGEYARRSGLTAVTVRSLMAKGEIKFHRVGKWARIPVEEYNKLPPLQAAQS